MPASPPFPSMNASQIAMHEITSRDRRRAGHRLAVRLDHYRGEALLVVGLAGGGVLVGAPIASKLRAPLDLMFTGAIRASAESPVAVGAAALGPVSYLDPGFASRARLTLQGLERLSSPAVHEVQRRTRHFRGRASLPAARGRTVILCDDGSSPLGALIASIWALRYEGASRVVVALSLGRPEDVARLREDADEVYCLDEQPPAALTFEPVDDAEIARALARAREEHRMGRSSTRWRAPRPEQGTPRSLPIR